MPIDGFVGTALGGLALMVFGAVLIWISLGSPVACLVGRTASPAKPGPRPNTTAPRSTESRRAAAQAARRRLDDALLTISLLDTAPLDPAEDPADPPPSDGYAFDPVRFDPRAGDAQLLRETADLDPAGDDFYCVAAIVARCAANPRQTRLASARPAAPPTPTAGYVTAFTGSLTNPIRSAA